MKAIQDWNIFGLCIVSGPDLVRRDGWMDDCLGGHCAAAMPNLTKASFSHEKLFPPTG